MSIKVTGYFGKTTCDKGDYKIKIFFPNNEITMDRNPQFGTTSVCGNLPLFKEGKEYTIEVEKNPNPRYKGSYMFVNLIGLEEEMEGESAHAFLSMVTSDTLATNILDKYPKFINMILENKEIDYSDIYGIGDKRFEQIKAKVNTQFKFFNIILKYPEYKISLKNARKISEMYSTIQQVYDTLDENPYSVLMEVFGYGFDKADRLILKRDYSWFESDIRLESCMMNLLNYNESQGNSYCNANDLYKEAVQIIPNCGSRIKDIAINSELLHYEDETKNISLESTYMAELQVAGMLVEKIKGSTDLGLDVKKYSITDVGTLTEEQEQVLKYANKYKVSIVDAPAGSGKTFTTNALCNMLDDNHYSYVLVSPSGAGAKRLAEATNRKASTIHKAVGYGGEPKEIHADFVIADEFGMTDLRVFFMLLGSIDEHTRLVLVGNVDQLSSVGLGNCMYDMIKSNAIPTTTLTKVHRFGVGGIMTASTKARLGEVFLDEREHQVYGQDKGFEFYQMAKDSEIEEQVIGTFDKLLKKGVSIDDIMCISPYVKGTVGAIALSSKIQNLVNPNNDNREEWSYEREGKTITFRVGDRVLNTKNNYEALGYEEWQESKELGTAPKGTYTIYNGMDGIVRSITKDIMVVQFDEDLIVFEKMEINRLLLRYVISCHRSQGQERKYIIGVVSPVHRGFLTSNLIYVMISRAKEKCYLFGDAETINDRVGVKDNLERMTQLTDFILKENENGKN